VKVKFDDVQRSKIDHRTAEMDGQGQQRPTNDVCITPVMTPKVARKRPTFRSVRDQPSWTTKTVLDEPPSVDEIFEALYPGHSR
jgi:hypothetical protein